MTSSPEPELLSRQHDGVLWLTINRPERRNAISPAVLAGLSEALGRANQDREVRAIVLTGVGDKAFCAGADLQTGQSFKFDYSEPTQGMANLFRLTRQLNVPLIARVNGACMAGGMGLMAMCDMAVAAPHAVFGLPEVKVGVFPAQVLSVLSGLIGPRALTELCITGEPITAAQALQLGLINHVSDDLDAGVQALLGRFLDKSPAAIRRGLYLMKRIGTMSFEQSMAFAESQIALFALTKDAAEGQAAFREKRKPRWSGK
ncbi:MAG TPA: enoyl-CoA hydratase/isomerase family protein [Ottowia sp.]|uniref:enoyl-CoA hydratase/isomerase family protein n=1 Tax=Ottowia sp. TaxID=1898956 RepID=UPI002C7585AA|nr:enoyl-CoA hydratase/isomerase family protein [Ottowia sp.]HNR81983.1 enoyl-CoA hydratase/isomerase family protein [Ottowia sp.]HNT84070.1 enoyl-CoA hydratase/isomerase family protein [Ottowia sp.]HOZ93379.1 enoyl-CoA hydratase/isomerase family protein [Ottowia sp.]HQO54147.1 enoyl-CoA hydratase/isomerase family protein [Ottowia sp.]HQQ53553.1 enoyl-CoA hydratase/isomerase family protein [Ottowia sp.]